jgi:hypothetical protein
MRFCRCTPPSPELVEGVSICSECGDRVADPMLLLIVKQQREILAQLKRLDEDPQDRQPDSGLLEPAELAKRLGKSRAWVYEHAEDLGAIRLGDGPRPRLYFDLERSRGRLAALAGVNRSRPEPARPSRRRRWQGTSDIELLPVKGSPRERAA